MADRAIFDSPAERSASPEPFSSTSLGRVRWTVCAMLSVATSINCMDRQVIAILKPTLEPSIGMTELTYGYIVDAGHILQLTHCYASLFGTAASVYLGALVILCLLAPGLKKVEPTT
jgi:hypothetical protein